MRLDKGVFGWALILFLASPVFAAGVIITKIDKNIYSPGANINVSGVVYTGSSLATNFNVNFTVFNSTNSSISTKNITTDSSGEFSALLNAPDRDGSYSLNISSGSATATIDFEVARVSSIWVELVSNVSYVPLSANKTFVNVSEIDPQINQTDARYGNFSYSNQYYYVTVEREGTKYKTVFLDDDNILWFNNSDAQSQPMYKFLEASSKLKLGGDQFELLYIDPLGSGLILAKKFSSTFAGGEAVKVLAVVLNGSDAPVSGVNTTLETFDEKGKQTASPANMGITGANGTIVYSRNIESKGGVYNLVVNKIGRISYQVRTYAFSVSLTTEDGTAVYAVKPGAQMKFTASVLNLSTNTPILQNFLMNITIVGPGCTPCNESETLINGTIAQSVNAPDSPGTYNVELAVEFQGVVQRRYIKFLVRGFNLFAFPVAKEKGPSEGFASGEQGAIFVGGTNMTSGELLNLSTLTGVGTSNPNLTLLGIFDSAGADKLSGAPLIVNVTEFFKNDSLAGGAPDFIKDEIRDRFGSDGAVILFTAPNENGIYQAKIRAIFKGTTEFVVITIGVQDIFVHAFPINPENGNFQPAVSPGGNVSLAIEAYDAITGTALPAKNITSVRLSEVFTENGTVVTDQMINESFGVASISFFGTTKNFSILSFIANDSIMGFHPARFKISANVTRNNSLKTVEALGEGWFEEKLFKTWVYPSRETRGFFGSDKPINLTVDVRDATGQSGQEGLRVTLDSLTHRDTRTQFDSTEIYGSDGETPADCTTGSSTNTTRAGTCDLSFVSPSAWGSWKSGGYEIKVKVTKTYEDGTTISDYANGWFEVRNLRFFAFSRSWEVSSTQDVTFDLVTEHFNGTGIDANVTMNELFYMGTWENWRPPTIINSSLGIRNTTNGASGGFGLPTGRITLPGGAFTEEGQYAVQMTASAGGMSETTMAWFYVRPFVIFIEPLEQNFERSYATGDNVSLSVRGYASFDWLSGNGTPHGLNASWVQKVEKIGFWGVDFKNRDRMISENNMSARCSGDQCNLSFNLSGFPQGEYMLRIIANDTQGSKAEGWFWFRIEQLRITVPELIEWLRALETHTMTNSTRITIDDACGGTTDTPAEPANVTNCKFKAVKLVEMRDGKDFERTYNYTFFLLDKDNNTIFVNSSGPGRNEELSSFTSVNFTGPPLKVKDAFTDTLGNRWYITGIDNASNYVYLEYASGVIGYNTWSYNEKEKKYDETYLFQINTSLSKSGKFLRADDLEDMDWMNVDLDGDGVFGFQERYYVVLADDVNASKFSLALVGNTTNLTKAVNSTDPKGIRLNESANPIYFLGLRYHSGASGGANYYKLLFTSNREGWPGRDLGIFKPGATIKVPVMVQKPSTRAPIENATVKVDKAVRFGFAGMEDVSVTSGVVNTSKAGIAIVNVSTSGLENGDYFFKIVVSDPSTPEQVVTTGTIWDNPRVSIRSFVVRGEIGLRGNISGIREWSVDAGNLKVNRSDEVLGGFLDYLDCQDVPGLGNKCFDSTNRIFKMGWWPYNQYLFYNDTSSLVGIDDGDWNFTSGASYYNPATEFIPIKKWNGNTEFMNASVVLGGYITIVNKGQSVVDRRYNITLVNTTPNINATLVVERINPWGNFLVASGTFNLFDRIIGKYDTGLNITGITASGITITWDYSTITLESGLTIEGRNKIARVLNISKIFNLSSDFEAVIYNSPLRQTAEDLDPNNEWKDTPDTVRIIYGNNGSLKAEYAVGQQLPEVPGWAVVKSQRWDERVYLSNLTGSGIVYPVPWVQDDNNVFYFGNFTEQSAKIKINPGEKGTPLSNKSYFMLLFDGEFNGLKKVSHAMVDDDLNFDDRWIKADNRDRPYDYDHFEGGRPEDWDPSVNFSERWFEIGRENWPFTITDFDETNKAVNLFSFKEFVSAKGENLTLWVTARDFDGSVISGNITVVKIVGIQFGPEGPVPTEVSTSGIKPVNLTNGTGYLLMTLPGDIKGGDYTARFRVNSADGRKELLEKHFWVEAGAGEKEFLEPPPLSPP